MEGDVNQILGFVCQCIAEKESLYEQTWRKIPVEDLIAIARIKTYRASTLLQKNEKNKLLDDLIDSIAYLLFAIIKVSEDDLR